MKIILIGEMSGVHNNLKKGLLKQGHSVRLISDGDNYKGFDSNARLIRVYSSSRDTRYQRIYNYIVNILYILRNIKFLFGNDVVQFISPFIIPPKYRFLTFALIRWNKKCSYYICGTNPNFLDAKNNFDYFPFDEDCENEKPNYTEQDRKYFNRFLRNMDYLIPAMYTYSIGFDSFDLKNPIPLPGQGVVKPINAKKSRISILHGISRFHFKGSSYILSALKGIKNQYGDYVDIDIIERVSFKEYMQKLIHSDIVIDQCKSYDYGMNAIIAMEHGKVVLSGAEPPALNFSGYQDCPIVNIKPDEKSIYQAIVNIISGVKLSEQKEKGLHFVNKYHNPDKVAKMFIDIWNKE